MSLAAKVDLPMDAANLVMPAAGATAAEVDASPVAVAVKAALATALAGVEAADITVRSITKTTAGGGRRRLAVDGIAVDYVIALPKVSS